MPLKLFKEIIQAKIASAESRRLFQKTTMSQLEDRLNWLGDEIDRAYDEIEKLWDAKEILLASISNAPHGNPTKKQRDKLNSIESIGWSL